VGRRRRSGARPERPERRREDAYGHERTKEQLYRQAKRLGIKGRSKMNKGQLKAALTRHGH